MEVGGFVNGRNWAMWGEGGKRLFIEWVLWGFFPYLNQCISLYENKIQALALNCLIIITAFLLRK